MERPLALAARHPFEHERQAMTAPNTEVPAASPSVPYARLHQFAAEVFRPDPPGHHIRQLVEAFVEPVVNIQDLFGRLQQHRSFRRHAALAAASLQ